MNLVVCHTLLNKDQKVRLNDSCKHLGIHVRQAWSDDVQLLVMHQLQMTPKFLLALIDKKNIVTPDYITAIRNRASLTDSLPDPLSYNAVWEAIKDEERDRIKHWRHRISGQIQVCARVACFATSQIGMRVLWHPVQSMSAVLCRSGP